MCERGSDDRGQGGEGLRREFPFQGKESWVGKLCGGSDVIGSRFVT
jgi:hypothetical protein